MSDIPSEPAIRVADESDRAELARLVAGFRDTLNESEPSDAEILERLGAVLADPANELCCARLHGQAVGYTWTRFMTTLSVHGLEAHLEDLFVMESARGRSVGRVLLRHALARAIARGAREISLNTNERNEPAQALYRSEGFTPAESSRYPGGRDVLWSRSLEAESDR